MSKFWLMGWKEKRYILTLILLAIWSVEVITRAQVAVLDYDDHEDGESIKWRELCL